MKDPFTLQSKNIEKTSIFQAIQLCFNLINHILIFSTASYMTYLCYHLGNQLSSWHALFCTFGYQVLMAESIMTLYTHNVWSKNLGRQRQRTIHWIMQALGSSIALVGISFEFIGRFKRSEPHLSSKHSIIGLIAAIFTLIGMISGMSSLWSVELKKFTRPIHFKLAHNFNGIVAFVLGMVAIFFGYEYNYYFKGAEENDETMLCMRASVIISIILTLIGAMIAFKNQVCTVFG